MIVSFSAPMTWRLGNITLTKTSNVYLAWRLCINEKAPRSKAGIEVISHYLSAIVDSCRYISVSRWDAAEHIRVEARFS